MGWRAMPHFWAILRGRAVCCHVGMLTDPYGTGPLTKSIIGCAIHVHRAIGPGVFENVYAECLTHELKGQGLSFERERPVPLIYKGVRLKAKYLRRSSSSRTR